MKQLFTIVAVCAFQAAAAETNTVSLTSLELGTNIYRRVVLTRKNAAEAVMRYDGGITKVKIAELPEPLRSKWLDEDAATRLKAERREQIKEGKERQREADAARRAAAIRATYRKVEGELVPISRFVRVTGRAERRTGGGLLLREPRYNRVPTGRRFGTPGAFGGRSEYAEIEVPGEGAYRFVRNAPSKPTGEYVQIRAHDLRKTITVGGVVAHLYDCGTVPRITPTTKKEDVAEK